MDAAGTTKYTFHLNGQKATEDGPWSNDTVTTGYSTNVFGLRTSLAVQQPTGSWRLSMKAGVRYGSQQSQWKSYF